MSIRTIELQNCLSWFRFTMLFTSELSLVCSKLSARDKNTWTTVDHSVLHRVWLRLDPADQISILSARLFGSDTEK